MVDPTSRDASVYLEGRGRRRHAGRRTGRFRWGRQTPSEACKIEKAQIKRFFFGMPHRWWAQRTARILALVMRTAAGVAGSSP